jgi:hypothetical protein
MSREFGICGSSGGGSALPKLAPDLTWPDDSGTAGSIVSLNGVNVQGSLQTALLAEGTFSFDYLRISANTIELTTVKLTIDGEVIWNSVDFTPGSQIFLYNADGTGALAGEGGKLVEETFLLEMETLTDTSININYILRPIA